jgi:alkylated DNA repair dioxygenase AlkB
MNTCSGTMGSVLLQGSLFASGEIGVADDAPTERLHLDAGSWVDLTRGWLGGADELCQLLATTVPWRQGRRTMYDREVDDPRLSCWFHDGDALPHPVLVVARDALERRYGHRFGNPGMNLYRDGADSVAFHRDRELRRLDDTLVAIVTLGGRRPFLVRPHGGGRSRDLAPASGDLLVMGGRCQLDWEHGVPKVARSGVRLSVSWRWTSRHGPTAVALDDIARRPIEPPREPLW